MSWQEGQLCLANGDALIEGTERPVRWRLQPGAAGGPDQVSAVVDVDRLTEWAALDVEADGVALTDPSGQPLAYFSLRPPASVGGRVVFGESPSSTRDRGDRK